MSGSGNTAIPITSEFKRYLKTVRTGGKHMNIKITADSTCDLSKELLEQYDISIIPLYVIKEGKAYRDGVDITPGDIFSHVDAGGAFCTTAAVNTYDYSACFNSLAANYDAIIHINIGSGFSMCHQNACAAAAEFKNVFVVDSQNLSSGQGHIVIEAAKMAKNGMDVDTILTCLEEMTKRIETSFLIDRLDYIYKGGRCSFATALGADILHLRTCVEVSGGKMQVSKKYRGSFESCVGTYVRDRLMGREDLVRERIFITHPAASKAAVDIARAAVKEYGAFDEVIETKAGCTISCHCGPKTLGILFIRK
jgi:DegV family protein with EDD domain